MTSADLRGLTIYETDGIKRSIKQGGIDTQYYIMNCIKSLYFGEYGATPPADVKEIKRTLRRGTGHFIARYQAAEGLESDVIILAQFDKRAPERLEMNYIKIMHPEELGN